MKTLDEEIRDALMALGKTVPQDYFDEFPARVEARLEVPVTDDKPSPDHDAASGDHAESSPRENTGLHDIKEMARTTRQKISRRISTQSDVEESLLSTSSSGLKAVVLPTPGKDTPRYESEGGASEAQAEESHGGGVPLWVYGAVGLVAAAAVVFFVVRGGGKDKPQVASTAGDVAHTEPGPVVAAIDPAATPDQPAPATPPNDDGVDQLGMESPAGVAGGVIGDEGEARDEDGVGDIGGTATATRPEAPRKAGTAGAKTSPSKTDRSSAPVTKKPDTKKPDTKPPAPPPAPDKKPSGGPASLEEILTEASGGAAGPDKEVKKDAKKAPSKTELSAGDIRTGMRSVFARVQACYAEHKQSGTVKVSVTVSPNGSVAKVSAVGQFASGAFAKTGACVASAVENAKFPAWDGEPKTFKYSYLLSD